MDVAERGNKAKRLIMENDFVGLDSILRKFGNGRKKSNIGFLNPETQTRKQGIAIYDNICVVRAPLTRVEYFHTTATADVVECPAKIGVNCVVRVDAFVRNIFARRFCI